MPSSTPVLFRGLIDDAAVFPPGNAPLALAVDRHRAHRQAGYADCIGPLLIPASAATDLLGLLQSSAEGEVPLRIGVIGRPGTDPAVVWKAFDLLSQSPTVEVVGAELGWTETLFESWPAGLPLAVEIPRGDTASTALSQIRVQRQSGHELIAKFRTGPTSTWPWPDEVELAHFIASTVALDVPFKLTGGLHHAIRGTYPVARTPEDNHGLLNILMATSKAVEGADPVELADILGDRDAANLADCFIRTADDADYAHAIRRAFRAYGCCEVTDPIAELTALDLLPLDHQPPDHLTKDAR
ncbi:MAG TPA: hypothetical protein PLA46_11880 [Phycicoccus sp.]|jgi:hypothetical protein|nr:hypothetical protein [Phycicoccus sp.]HQH08743.1 hypothetical protein [Phycicoccus sp.]HQK31421.1 hypothetical protein [Phycicoccus sp.]HQV92274.1 hypothetical protein [Phycicoccus sp.]HQY97259.1 hypothetical protein [Phycicoccus sp.]